MQFILGFLLALTFFFLLRNAFQAPPAKKKRLLMYLALGLAGFVLLLLVITGRLHFLAALSAGLLLVLRRLPQILSAIPIIKQIFGSRTSSAASSGQSSIDTSLLRMVLDHASGKMDGQILSGKYTGQRLSAMDVEQLRDLYLMAIQDNPDSVELLETYFEREFGPDWRDQFQIEDTEPKSPPSNDSEMSAEDAMDILGLSEDFTEQDVTDAHRRMMQKFHPDRGGSNYIASKINEAKRILLDHVRT